MNIYDEMSDNEVLRAAAGTLSASPVPAAPEARAIMARGRARRRRRLAGAGAAAGVLVAGAAFGISAGLPGSPVRTDSHPAAVAGLTAVSGCPGLYATAGTLERVTGASLVIRSFVTGKSLTLATSSATSINHEAPGALADVTNGARVFVAGSGIGRPALAAHWVITGMDLLKRDRTVHHGRPEGHFTFGNVAVGTVADANPGGFTVIMGPGLLVPVTTFRPDHHPHDAKDQHQRPADRRDARRGRQRRAGRDANGSNHRPGI